MNKISNQIKKIISQKMEIPISKIHNDTHLSKDLNIDSLDMIEIIMTIEEKFNIEIPENISDSFESINFITKYVKNIINSSHDNLKN
ncbi:acyl carrier protein [Buchnera aphidicola]|uniref:acyl carrier protein n=1 Tax=Buchnera aphidicola TaxID=9 RepID=UPI0034643906